MYTFEDGVLKIWTWYSDPISGEPTVLQPFDPNTGENWGSDQEAIDFAEAWLALPGNSEPEIVEEPVSPEEGTDPVLVAEEE
jgi:hypothetical protein